MKIKNTYFYTFLFSYVAILSIPIIVFTVVVYSFLHYSFLNEVFRRNQYNLDDVHNRLKVQIDTLGTIGQQVAFDSDFSSYRLTSNGGGFIAVQEKIKRYTHTNDFVDSIQFLSNSTGFIYGIFNYSIDRYCSEAIINNHFSSYEYQKTFTTSYSPVWIPMSNVKMEGITKEIATYILPVEKSVVDSKIIKSSLILHISKQAFTEIVSPLLLDESSKVSIHINGIRVYCSDTDFFDRYKEDMYSHPNTANTLSTYHFDKTEYYSFTNSQYTNDSNIKIDLYVPSQAIKKVTDRIIPVSLLFLAISLLFGTLVILLALKYSYFPIRKLSDYASHIYRSSIPHLNEVENTRNALQKLIDDNSNISRLNSQYSREKTLVRLISNSAGDREMIVSECRESGIDTGANYYICSVVAIGFKLNNENLFSKQKFYDFLNTQNSVYCTEFVEFNTLVFIMGSSFDDYDALEKILNSIISNFFNTNCIRMGVGNFVDSIFSLNQSYCQALIALNRGKRQNLTMVFFKQFMDFNAEYRQYNRKDLSNLYLAITNTDVNSIKRRMELIKKSIRTCGENEYIWTYICHDIVNTCIQAIDVLEIPTGDLFNKYSYILHNTRFISVDHVITVINQLASEVVEIIEFERVKSDSKKDAKYVLNIDEVCEYIKSNYTDPSFSVKAIADDFNTSISNLSHFFKSKTDKNISDYINELKMEEAKKLLLETELPISEIVTKIGGLYSSSFIRNFKKCQGMTPGEFRIKMKAADRNS